MNEVKNQSTTLRSLAASQICLTRPQRTPKNFREHHAKFET